MQVALISDVQGNAFALENVLQHISQANVEKIICLGDVATGPEPTTVLALLRAHQVICVRGNMDEVVLDPPQYSGEDRDERRYAEIDQWCHAQLTPADRVFLQSLPITYSFTLQKIRVCCAHGSPKSNQDVIDATTSITDLDLFFKDIQADIYTTGHMHQPMLRTYGSATLINPGSVGLPFGAERPMPTYAEYAMLNFTEGAFMSAFYRVQMDARAFKDWLLNCEMPHKVWYLSKWMVDH